MKKKLGTLCLAGVIILCAGACGSKSGDKTEQTAQNNTENARIVLVYCLILLHFY